MGKLKFVFISAKEVEFIAHHYDFHLEKGLITGSLQDKDIAYAKL